MNWTSLITAICLLASIAGCAGSVGSPTSSAQTAETAYARGDFGTALQKWRPRAQKGDVEAQYGLGYMYRNGQGVAPNNKEAAKWYEKAAKSGHAKSQVKLGLMYAKGDGFRQDLVQAHKWFNLAASTGHKDAARARDKIAKIMSTEEIETAQRLAREFAPAK